MEEVLAKYFSGEATKDEITLVESWRSESKTNANAFFEAKNVWVDAQQETAAPKHILNEILREPQAKQVPFILKNWVKYASAAVLVLAISLLFVLNQNQTDSTYTNQELSDGSEIALHGSSTMEILKMNESVREVSVSGKAYFNIERDESRPFIIHTDNALIKVLGTSFLVKSSESSTEVCVESGLVEFTKDVNGSNGVSVKLAKGEMGLITNNNVGIVKRNNSDLNYLAWKTKVMTFESTPMSQVEKILEDVYGIDVQFENPAFKNCKLTAKFNKKKVKEALEIISRTFKIEYEYSDGKAVLKGLGC